MFEGTTICVIFKNCDYLEFFKLTILMGERGMADISSSTTSLTGLLATSKVKVFLTATCKVKVSLTGVFSTSTVRLPGLVIPLLGLRQAIGAASCSLLWKEFSLNFHLSNMKRYYRATDLTTSPAPHYGLTARPIKNAKVPKKVRNGAQKSGMMTRNLEHQFFSSVIENYIRYSALHQIFCVTVPSSGSILFHN